MPSEQSSANDPPSAFFSEEMSISDLEDNVANQEYRTRLRTLVGDDDLEASETLQALLQLGTEWFDVEHGHLVEIDPADGTHRITEVSGSHPIISRGDCTDLSATYCRMVVTEESLMLENAPEQGWADDPAYEQFEFPTYLGAKVVVAGKLYGTVCFVDRTPREESFRDSAAAALALIANAVERQLDQTQHQDRLRRSTPRLEALFEDSPNMINIHDQNGNLIVPNPRLCEATGYDEEELVQMKVWDLDETVDPEEAKRVWNEMDPGDRHRWEGVYRRKDGSTFPVEVDVRCLDLDGDQQFLVTSRDISDRKEAEAALAEAEARYESLTEDVFEKLPGGVLVLDADFEVVWTNEAVERFFGLDREEMIGSNKAQLVESTLKPIFEEPDRFAKTVLATYEDNTHANKFECHVRPGPHREERWLQHQSHPIRHGRYDGGRVEVYTDITERKNAEQTLRESETRFRTLFEAHSAPMLLVDPEEGTIVDANASAAEFYGYAPDTLTSKSIQEINVLSAEEVAERRAEAESETQNRFVFPHRLKSGEIRTVEVHSTPITVEGTSLLFSIIHDITERKEMEEKLRRREKQLRSITENISDGIYRSSPGEGLIYANQAFADMFGYDRVEEILDVDLSSLYADPSDRVSRLDDLASMDTFDAHEVKFRRRDGTTFTGLLSGTVVRDEDGEVQYFDGAITDITQQKRHQRELERYRAYTDRLLDGIDDIFFVQDEEGRLQRWNESLAEVTGYTDEELDSMKGVDLLPEKARERAAARIEQVFDDGYARLEALLRTKDGATIPYEYAANRVEHLDGEPRLVGIGRDITDRKHAEEALREREAQLRGLANSIPGVLYQFYVRPDGRTGCYFISDRAESILGIAPDPDTFHERFTGRILPPYREKFLNTIARNALRNARGGAALAARRLDPGAPRK
ncbi:MAG: PAS domain S-box protein [Salinibacter sp.]